MMYKKILIIILMMTMIGNIAACESFSEENQPVDRIVIDSESIDITQPPVSETSGTEMISETETAESEETTSVAVTEKVTEKLTEPETEPPPKETEIQTLISYITVPKFLDYYEEKAKMLFEESGIQCSVIYEYGAYDPGLVYKFTYHGYANDENYFIEPDTDVVLYVSKGRYEFIQQTISHADDSKRIYLTFDDGPNRIGTDKVLETLAKYDIKATFFLVGEFAGYYPERVKTIYNSGHVIGCHSYTHQYKKLYESVDSLMEEINEWEDLIFEILGTELPVNLFRFPGGTTNSFLAEPLLSELLQKLDDEGYKSYDWTISNNDASVSKRSEGQTEIDYVKASFLNGLDIREYAPNLPKIVLMHDVKEYTAESLEWIIEYLIDCGYSFGTLDELEHGWIFR